MVTDFRTRSLAELVVANPNAARVLDAHGLDYCCHGERDLAAACAEAGVDADEVARQLTEVPVDGDTSWAELPPAQLVAHLLAVHHEYLHAELPLLDALADKVAGVHGSRHPELAEVRRLVAALRADLEPHLAKEEEILFPAITALATSGDAGLPMPVAGPIRVMLMEHDSAGELLAQLRTATGDFAVPADGCASYHSLYERLETLEQDTHLHVLKENHTLFPAALALADQT